MPSILSVALAPIILLISIPLFLFAVFTTTLAFSTLLIRVLIVYIELAIVVTHNHFSTPRPTKRDASPHRPKSISHKSSSRSSSGSLTPKLPSVTNSIYPITPLARDFEGVGGWRFPDPNDDDDSDALWTNMNSRLELPAGPALGITTGELILKHERSLTGSLTARSTTSERPGVRRQVSHRARPFSAFVSGISSPEEVYSERLSKSVADWGDGVGLGMNVGKVKGVKHRKSSSSISTASSGKTRRTSLGGE